MSDAVPVSVPVILVQSTQTPTPIQSSSGKVLPQGGKADPSTAILESAPVVRANAQTESAKAATPATATNKASVSALVQQLNKYLNDSGRANTFRVDPASRDQTIQEINPATGEVIGEFAAIEFPALARSLGVSGILVDSHA